MPFNDLREYIDRLEQEGEVQRIEEEVDWDLEAGAMLHYSYEQQGMPAPFFQKIKDYPEGYRLFGGTLGSYKRSAIAMDIDPDASPHQLVEEYIKRIKKPIKPVMVSDGPCKENIIIGDDVDVLKFPVPQIIPDDGQRFIGTLDLVVAKELNSEWVNWGTHRVAVHNRNTLGVLIHRYTHLGTMLRNDYEPINKPMEVAVVISADPISAWTGGIPVPWGVSEVEIAGGMRREPVKMIKCETIDLAVPATAEIVIEGEIRPHDRMEEGPFGEYAGYVASLVEPRPVIRVKAITHRNDPILTMAAPGIPYYEGLVTANITRAAELLDALKGRGIPVSAVSVPPEGGCLIAVVAVNTLYSNIAEQVAHVIWGSVAGIIVPYIIVVDKDVDPFNMAEVIHALASKCHPYRGIMRQKNTLGSPLWPFLNAHERLHKLGSRAYFDCTWPLDWDVGDVPARVAFKEIYPTEVQQRALAKWQNSGTKGKES
jgi:4-hydroxy-3-polyprenylbenzoate decarboxylase